PVFFHPLLPARLLFLRRPICCLNHSIPVVVDQNIRTVIRCLYTHCYGLIVNLGKKRRHAERSDQSALLPCRGILEYPPQLQYRDEYAQPAIKKECGCFDRVTVKDAGRNVRSPRIFMGPRIMDVSIPDAVEYFGCFHSPQPRAASGTTRLLAYQVICNVV